MSKALSSFLHNDLLHPLRPLLAFWETLTTAKLLEFLLAMDVQSETRAKRVRLVFLRIET
jgi:hypothetical protein